MSALAAWGASALLAWLGLPLLFLAARARADAAPASRTRALTLALASAAALLFVPLGRLGAPLAARQAIAAGAAGPVPVLGEAVRAAVTPLAALALVWLVLVALGLARLLWLTARDLSLAGRDSAPSAPALSCAERLARELGIAPPRLVVSRRAALPFVLAIPRTTVVLPQVIVDSLDEPALELVLRHELTHLSRGDHLVAVLLELLKLPFTLHPAAARLCAEIGLAREMAVDERIGAVAPRAYAHLLVDVAEIHRFGPREAGEVALEPCSLERRIQMLTRPARHRPAPLLPTLLLAAGLACGAALLPSPVAFAEEGKVDPGEATLAVGSQRVLHYGEIARIAVGDPAVVDVRPLGKTQVLLWGLTAGRTTVLVWTADGQRHTVLVTVK